jgi:hypothetical protein
MTEPGRNPARLPSSRFTMSNSPLRGLRRAASLVPAAHVLRPGCHVALSPRISAAFADHCAGLRPETLVVISSDPRTEGPAERREAHYLKLCRAGKTRRHACEA